MIVKRRRVKEQYGRNKLMLKGGGIRINGGGGRREGRRKIK